MRSPNHTRRPNSAQPSATRNARAHSDAEAAAQSKVGPRANGRAAKPAHGGRRALLAVDRDQTDDVRRLSP